MLTARTGLPDRVRGLDVGADDYLVKPFALQRLDGADAGFAAPGRAGRDVRGRRGRPQPDASRHLVHRGTTEPLPDLKGPAVLRYLMSRPGHLVSAESLEHVWDENADPFTQTVRVTVGTLRRSSPPPVKGRSSRPSSGAGTAACRRPGDDRRSHRGSGASSDEFPLGPNGADAAGAHLPALLFAVAALLLGGVYLALSTSIDAPSTP